MDRYKCSTQRGNVNYILYAGKNVMSLSKAATSSENTNIAAVYHFDRLFGKTNEYLKPVNIRGSYRLWRGYYVPISATLMQVLKVPEWVLQMKPSLFPQLVSSHSASAIRVDTHVSALNTLASGTFEAQFE